MPTKKVRFKSNIKNKLVLGFGSFAALAVAIGVTATAIQKPTADPRSFASENSIHRIGIRTGANNKKEFFDTVTGSSIVFRGNIYVRKRPAGASTELSDFIPGEYNREKRAAALAQMKQDGYNSVRILIDQTRIIDGSGNLSDGYLSNLADFLKLSKDNELYVFVTFRRFPQKGQYRPTNPNPDIISKEAPYHAEYLIKSFVDARKRYLKDVVAALKDKGAPLEVVALWTFDNEPYFQKDFAPLSLTSGVVTAANGQTYDMASDESKLKMMDDSMVYVMNEARAAIKEADPQALVGLGLFSQAADGSKTRISRTAAVFTKSNADFVDVHYYPMRGKTTLEEDMESYGVKTITKPIIVGAYGAFGSLYPTSAEAAALMADIQVKSCQAGHQGWFAYDYDLFEVDPAPPSPPPYHHVMGGNQEINKALAPKYRANPCSEAAVAAIGGISSIDTSGKVTGWFFDQEATIKSQVNIYIDGSNPNSGKLIGTAYTDQVRVDVQKDKPWMSPLVGFSFQLPAEVMKDSKSHTLHIQAVDMQLDGDKKSYLLPGSGFAVPQYKKQNSNVFMNISCGPNVVDSQCINKSQNLILVVKENETTSPIVYASWNTSNGLDDLVKQKGAKLAEGVWQSIIKLGNHPGNDDLMTNVWKFDSSGKQQWCASVKIPICK